MKWNRVRLGQIFDIARGGSPRPINDYLTNDPDGVNWISISDASESSKYITATKRRIKPSGVSKSRMVHEGDLLLTNSMSFGRPYIVKISGCIHDGWLVLGRQAQNIDPHYFYHLLGSENLYREFERLAAGATVKNLNIDLVRSVEVLYPPLDEQRRIAAILDQADDLRRKRREALERLQRLVPSIFLEMFGDIRENRRKWPVVCLGDAGKLDRGVSRHRPRNDPILLGGPHPLIQTGDIANCDGYIRNFNSTYSDEGLRQSKKWPAGTLCITIAANIGKTGILSFDACFPDSVVGFTSGKQVKTEFIQEWLRFLQPELEKDAPQFAQKNINLETLRSLSLFIPPLDLQEAFAARVAEIDKLKAHHRAHLARLDALFASLQHLAFRGDLSVSPFSRSREKVASRSEVG